MKNLKLNLTKSELENLTHNPDLTLIIGRRDYMKEALADCVTLQSELDTVKRSRDGWEQEALLYAKNLENLRQNLKDAVGTVAGKIPAYTVPPSQSDYPGSTMQGLAIALDILRSHGLIEE